MTNLGIRPFRGDDRTALVVGRNQERSAHQRETVGEWEREDAQKPEGEVQRRLCIGEPAIAYLGIVDRGTSLWRMPDVCQFTLWVAPERRNQGIGSALYNEVLEFARERRAKRLTTLVQFFAVKEPAERFLAKRGFAEVDREVPVLLDLLVFDRSKFTAPIPTGVRLLSLADAGDTEEHRRKIYALVTALQPDVPTNDAHAQMPAFVDWVKRLDEPERDPRSAILAQDDAGDWVGISSLSFQEETNIGWTTLTGVLPEHRGQGIAYALKLRALDAALARGCPLILTENHEDNAPMRAINRKLGFVPDAPSVSYSKNLQETRTA